MPLTDIFKSKQEIEAEQKRQQKRELRDATRSCDKIQADLDRQIKDLEIQIKDAAKKNDQVLAKTLAKQLIRVRNERTRSVGAKSKISAISSHANSIQINQKLAGAMASSAAAMSKINQGLQPEKLAQQMSQFQAETTKMDMKDSALNDMFDELFEEDDEEADSIMNQVLDELAIDTSAMLSKLPTTTTTSISEPQVMNKLPSASAKVTEKH